PLLRRRLRALPPGRPLRALGRPRGPRLPLYPCRRRDFRGGGAGGRARAAARQPGPAHRRGRLAHALGGRAPPPAPPGRSLARAGLALRPRAPTAPRRRLRLRGPHPPPALRSARRRLSDGPAPAPRPLPALITSCAESLLTPVL